MKPFQPQRLPLNEIIWEPLIPLIGRANRALAHYDGVLYGVPNPEIMLSPLTTQEAVLSSKIEGTQATLGEVLKYEAGEKPHAEEMQHDIQEILNYRRALRNAEKSLNTRPFNLNLLLELHDTLLDSVRGRDKARGRFRTEQNWIGRPNTPISQAYFVPPPPMFLMEYLDNWEKFYHQNSPDPIVQLAIVHAQFEILHPFLDGNGRLGRILIPLFLHEKQLLSRPMFYLSEWLEEHREDYVSRLRELGRKDGAWDQWIAFFLRGVEEQAARNARRAREIMDLYERLKTQVIELTRSQFAVHLLDSLFCRPIFQSTHIKFPAPSPTRAAVANLLKSLRDAGIIKVVREGSGSRAAVYYFPELLDICEGRGKAADRIKRPVPRGNMEAAKSDDFNNN
jgi:Fic family protein